MVWKTFSMSHQQNVVSNEAAGEIIGREEPTLQTVRKALAHTVGSWCKIKIPALKLKLPRTVLVVAVE